MGNTTKSALWIICPVLSLQLIFAGCTSSQYVKYVEHADNTYVVRGDSQAVQYRDNSEAQATRYVKKDGDLIRITPERNQGAAGETQEPLAPIDAELLNARTPAALEDYVAKYAPAPQAFVAVQRIAKPALDARDWAAASDIFTRYRDKFPSNSLDFIDILNILSTPEEGVAVNNLGFGINSSEGEYSPVVSSDGKTLYFARDCGVCNGGEEIYVSHRNQDGRWGMARPFGSPLATGGHEVPLGVSSDGNILAVYGNYPGAIGRGDIFFTRKSSAGWTTVAQYPPEINTEYFESNAMYTADGKAMLFISERPGGVGDFKKKGSYFHGSYSGNTDIYVQITNGDGTTRVVNLGPTINTPYSEYSPYLHPDGKTLYFSSDGHPGLGGLDVFKSVRLSDTSWTEWSQPINLGKEINTSGDDWGYQVATSGELAYFAVNDRDDGFGGSDIYTIGLPEQVKPNTVITISGTVTDPDGDGLEADIVWNDLESQQEVGYASSDPLNGEYVIHLPSGGHYGYYANKEGYIGESENFNLKNDYAYKEFVLDIVLYPVPKKIEPVADVAEVAESSVIAKPMEEYQSVTINMNNIFFDFDKYSLRSESTMELERWVKFLSETPGVTLEIYGHTDSVGTESYNQNLSERRARSVAGYLADHGISVDRLAIFGMGETTPVASNESAAGRQQNRRVEVKIINQ